MPVNRARARTLTLAIVVTICVGWAAGCQEDNLLIPGARTGRLLVTLITTGGNPDSDGFHLLVDQGPPIVVSPADEVSLTLPNGSHTVAITGLAANCAVSGGDLRPIYVAPGGTTAVTFQISCPFYGAMRISTTTGGTNQDSDGYLLNMDGVPRSSLAAEAVLDINELRPGVHVLRLSSVAGNCSIAQGATRQVNVTEQGTATVLFAVTCVPRIDDTPGERLVVASRPAGEYDVNLYFREVDASGVQRLTDNVGDELNPEISPDGKRILFLQWKAAGRSLTVLDRMSRRETVLPTLGVDRAVWSPDGNSIAFTRAGRLFRMNSDGTGEVLLASEVGNHITDPYWSPDGTRIAFTLGRRVFLVNADGSGLQRISDLPRTSGPWSPDGSSILLTELVEWCTNFYYCYYYGSSWTPRDLVILHVATGQETPLTRTWDLTEWSPVWAADGQRIFFLAAPGGNADVFSIRRDGTGAGIFSATMDAETWISIGRIP